jgi:hypothetical protein
MEKMEKIVVRSYWLPRNGADKKLVELGYILSENEIGYEGLWITPEDAPLFTYKRGTPHCPGILILK